MNNFVKHWDLIIITINKMKLETQPNKVLQPTRYHGGHRSVGFHITWGRHVRSRLNTAVRRYIVVIIMQIEINWIKPWIKVDNGKIFEQELSKEINNNHILF